MKKTVLLVLFATLITACGGNKQQFKVEGQVEGADGKTLYFEQAALNGILLADSVKLGSSGSFKFYHEAPEAPDFYRLRIEDKIINFCVDSTETIHVEADYAKFATDYTIADSDNNLKIKELSLMLAALQEKVNQLTDSYNANKISNLIFTDSLAHMINAYKNEVKAKYIYAAPNTPYAYHALFQRVGQYTLFDPLSDKEDVRAFGAVATSFNNLYPHSERAKNIYNIAIKGMRNVRQADSGIEVNKNEVAETGIIDIELRDIDGNVRKLSDLSGKVVVLDFTTYQADYSADHNLLMREVYAKYAGRGLEIYQVSLDTNEHFWKTAADKLPWVCVREPRGAYSDLLNLYNFQSLPAVYVINRDNELSARVDNLENLEAALNKLL
ncbi:MAG: redoxin domain-containing protein [Bacteroidaceae bacterium]|nr:redoxin domain-containing protein [Bacteroidaceae bacterium]